VDNLKQTNYEATCCYTEMMIAKITRLHYLFLYRRVER